MSVSFGPAVRVRRALVLAFILALVAPLAAAPAGVPPAVARAAFDPGATSTAVTVAAGPNNTCVVFSDGTIRCSGWNNQGALGDGSGEWGLLPRRVAGIENAVDVAVGYSHGCALLDDATVSCWGRDEYGELGDDATFASSPVPVPAAISDVTAISASGEYTCAITGTGTVRCWGRNDTGQLGVSSATTSASGVPVTVPGVSTAVGISAGGGHACALLSDATVTCWGRNEYGQLGDGTLVAHATPAPVAGLSDVVEVTAGYDHTCARLTDGTLRCWGANYYTQLGAGYDAHQQCTGPAGTWDCSPSPLTVLDISSAVSVDAGAVYTCAVLADGTGRCWGVSGAGKLGNGTDTGSYAAPVTVTGLDDATSLVTGWQHACAMRTGDAISCWGANNTGALMDGTLDNALTPRAADLGLPTVAYDPATTSLPGTIGWKVVFDKPVTGVTIDDFDMAGSTATCTLQDPTGAGTTWTITMTGCTDGELVLRLHKEAGADAAGLLRPAFTIATAPITLDLTAPWVSASFSGSQPVSASSFTYDLTASEVIEGFTTADVSFDGPLQTATGCTASVLGQDPLDQLHWTLTVSGCGSGVVQPRIAAAVFTDVAGNPGPSLEVLADTVLVDRSAPSVSTPTVALRTGARLSGTQAPVRVKWTASDNVGGAGLASMQLERSLNGGAWTAVGPASLATSADVLIPTGGTVRFRVRALDGAGNATTKTSATVTPRLVQQSSSAVAWKGTWTTTTGTAWSGGSARYAKARGASVTFTFTGRSVSFVAATASARGRAKVYVNGTYVTTIDLKGSSAARVLAFTRTWSTSATRRLTLVVLGTSGRPRVDADAFIVFR